MAFPPFCGIEGYGYYMKMWGLGFIFGGSIIFYKDTELGLRELFLGSTTGTLFKFSESVFFFVKRKR